jgi:hypothetical protein
MVEPIYSNSKIRSLIIRANSVLEGKSKTSSKKLSIELNITPAMAVRILWRLGWFRHRRNGASGTVYYKEGPK